MEIEIDTVASGWGGILSLFEGPEARRRATRHGVTFDISALTVVLNDVNSLELPEAYIYPTLLQDWGDRLFGEQQQQSLFFQRLTRWNPSDAAPNGVDQMNVITELLSSDPQTRSGVFTTWDPSEDLSSEFPVSPVGGAFRILDEELHLLLTARSVDVWVGLVPELLTFCRLVSSMAIRFGLRRGRIVYHCWSAHIYETDMIVYLQQAND